jgi:hypothetical protein
MDNFPLDMAVEYRWAFGLLLMVYSAFVGYGLLMIIETKNEKESTKN